MFDQPGNPYSALFAAVIHQAIDDARSKSLGHNDRTDAHSFLTESTGAWARSRAAYCDALGIDADAVREHALRLIPSETNPELPKEGSNPRRVFDLLCREQGATKLEIEHACPDWKRETLISTIRSELGKKGWEIEQRQGRYRIVNAT